MKINVEASLKLFIFSVLAQLIFFQNAFGFQPKPTLQFDDRQPNVMTFLSLQPDEKFFQQFHVEYPFIQESVFSFTQKKDVSVREQSAYSYNLGYNDGIHHFGVQVAGTFVKLFPFLLSVNYQIDFLNWKGFLFSMSTMYGGIRYDRERYGGLVMASYRDGYRNYFASIQYLKSRRHFYSANAAIDGINGAPDNSLSYLLQSTTTSAGIRFSDNQHSKASIELGLGWENNLVLDQYNIQIQPINYSHSDGAVIFASVIIPFQNLNLPNSSKEFE